MKHIYRLVILASSWVLGHLISACFAGFLNDAIGRKKCLLIDTVVFFLGFILLSTSHSTSCLVVARFMLGYPLVSQVWLDSNEEYVFSSTYISRFSSVRS